MKYNEVHSSNLKNRPVFKTKLMLLKKGRFATFDHTFLISIQSNTLLKIIVQHCTKNWLTVH